MPQIVKPHQLRRYVKLEEQENCQTPFWHKAIDRASKHKRNKTSKKTTICGPKQL